MTIKMFDDFLGNDLNEEIWFPFYLPQWSSRKNAVATYRIKESVLTLYIADDQKPWCPSRMKQITLILIILKCRIWDHHKQNKTEKQLCFFRVYSAFTRIRL